MRRGCAATINVGTNGKAFGVANNTHLSVWQILKATDTLSTGGNQEIYNGNQTLRNLANAVFSFINEKGGISKDMVVS